jgi:hypothetical protein
MSLTPFGCVLNNSKCMMSSNARHVEGFDKID